MAINETFICLVFPALKLAKIKRNRAFFRKDKSFRFEFLKPNFSPVAREMRVCCVHLWGTEWTQTEVPPVIASSRTLSRTCFMKWMLTFRDGMGTCRATWRIYCPYRCHMLRNTFGESEPTKNWGLMKNPLSIRNYFKTRRLHAFKMAETWVHKKNSWK